MSETQAPPMVAICMPGYHFDWQWTNYWTDFILNLLRTHSACYTFAASNNIYFVRNRCLAETKRALAGVEPDYLLWIDSDNLVTYPQFLILKQALIDHPEAAGVGAWYYVQSGIAAGAEIAAGWYPEGGDQHVSTDQIREYKDIIEVDYIGFGMLLMRGSMLKDMGEDPFVPLANGQGVYPDDASFTMRAKQKGLRFFLHPGVHVPHLKSLPLIARTNV